MSKVAKNIALKKTKTIEEIIKAIKNIETGEKIEDLETKVSVKDFTMDNYNLSISFEVELSEKTKS